MAKKYKSSSESDKGNAKVCAILSYIFVGLIWYLVDEKMKKDSFVKYHVKQGLVLLIASILYAIVLGIIFSVLFIPFVFTGMGLGLMAIYRLLSIVPWIFVIIGIINAANNKEKELPIIGKYAKKFTF